MQSDDLRATLDQHIRATWWPHKNWGDNLNPWLINKLSGGKLVEFCEASDKRPKYACVGSIMNRVLNENVTVWGSGMLARNEPFDHNATFLAVRGPLTREVILERGGQCPPIYGDPALLVPSLYYPAEHKKKFNVGFIPHYIDQGLFDIDNPLYTVIDITLPIKQFVDRVLECDVILSSTLHGIICAHSYGVPAQWIKMSDNLAGDGIKFKDYFLSVGQEPQQCINLARGGDIKKIVNNVPNVIMDIDLMPLLDACPFYNVNEGDDFNDFA